MVDAPTPPDPLDALERDVAALVSPALLWQAIEATGNLAVEPGERGIRYAIARGIVENRNGFFEAALTTLHKARRLAADADADAYLATISREIARVHSWRGDARAAALELLRALVEAEESGSRLDVAAALAEVGRVNLEVGRYEAALGALERAAKLAPGVLAPREPARIAVNRCEALLALGGNEECLALIDASMPVIRSDHRRENFVIRLLKAHALLRLGRRAEAETAANEAASYRSNDAMSYEDSEWQVLEGLMLRERDPAAAIAALQSAIGRFADEDLPRHEIEARIHLAEILAAAGRVPEAEISIAEALRRCEARQLQAMGDRARAAAIGFWSKERIADLSGDNVLAPKSGAGGGRFLVIERLGSGGFGSVERAIDENTGDEVAIKRMRVDASKTRDQSEAMFATVRNEVRAAGKVASRSYVARTRYLNIDHGGAIVLVQDFVRGPTLRAILDDEAYGLPRRLTIAANLARAIAGIHAQDIAHRDLKPDNVLLRDGRDPVLVDLGLARFSGSPDTLSGMGTPPYAAPEQWEANPDPRWTGREDIYALGVIVTELVGDELPADKPAGALASLRQRFGRKTNLAPKAAKLVQTMLAKDPAAREVDLHEVAVALEEAAAEASTRS
jgi:tetratricopeptide (TPR) repeat protein